MDWIAPLVRQPQTWASGDRSCSSCLRASGDYPGPGVSPDVFRRRGLRAVARHAADVCRRVARRIGGVRWRAAGPFPVCCAGSIATRARCTRRAVVRDSAAWIMFLLRLSPLVPHNLLNYALALSGVRFRDYLVALVGMLPAIIMYAYYGKVAGDVTRIAAGVAPPAGNGVLRDDGRRVDGDVWGHASDRPRGEKAMAEEGGVTWLPPSGGEFRFRRKEQAYGIRNSSAAGCCLRRVAWRAGSWRAPHHALRGEMAGSARRRCRHIRRIRNPDCDPEGRPGEAWPLHHAPSRRSEHEDRSSRASRRSRRHRDLRQDFHSGPKLKFTALETPRGGSDSTTPNNRNLITTPSGAGTTTQTTGPRPGRGMRPTLIPSAIS